MNKTRRFPIFTLVFSALILWIVQGLGLSLVQVRGPSMVPSYLDGQILFVNRLAYGLQGPIIGDYLWIWKAPGLGDPVVVKKAGGAWAVKRVAGLPGMPLIVTAHHLTVGPRTVALSPSQEYWLSSCSRVPLDSVFVLGDNLDRSADSRDWGFVPLRDVLGRPFF